MSWRTVCQIKTYREPLPRKCRKKKKAKGNLKNDLSTTLRSSSPSPTPLGSPQPCLLRLQSHPLPTSRSAPKHKRRRPQPLRRCRSHLPPFLHRPRLADAGPTPTLVRSTTVFWLTFKCAVHFGYPNRCENGILIWKCDSGTKCLHFEGCHELKISAF